MTEDQIQEILDKYGFEWVLKDHDLTLVQVLLMLSDYGFVYLDDYLDSE